MGHPFDDDPEVRKFLKAFEKEGLPNIKDSAMVMSIVTDHEVDAKMCLEVGAAVLLDKPLIVAAFRGARVPANLKRVATEIVEINGLEDADAQRKMRDAINRVIENDKRVPRSAVK